jgi:flagellar basal-body rod protein FlgC
MEVIANNMANVGTTAAGVETVQDADGRAVTRVVPFRRKQVAFRVPHPHHPHLMAPMPLVVDDPSEFPKEHNPSHPDAGPDGMVRMPNVNFFTEYTDMIQASRAYEANVTAIDVLKTMEAATLRILA